LVVSVVFVVRRNLTRSCCQGTKHPQPLHQGQQA